MKSLRLPPFRLIHAAYVTGDLDKGKRKLAAMFGVLEVRVYSGIGVDVPGGVAMIDFALANANGTALEVIQPTGGKDAVYRRALPAQPTDIAFHHFASRILCQAEWDMVLEAVDHHGFEVPVRGGTDDYRYIYLDARAHLGHMLEFIWFVSPDAEAAGERVGQIERISQ